MEAPNISHTFWGGPFLDGLDFLRVHLDPISTNTYKSEARASPPGLSIRIIAALYLFDSEEKKKAQCDLQNYDTNIITKKNKA